MPHVYEYSEPRTMHPLSFVYEYS